MAKKKQETEFVEEKRKERRVQSVGGIVAPPAKKEPLQSVLHKVTRPKYGHGISSNRQGRD